MAEELSRLKKDVATRKMKKKERRNQIMAKAISNQINHFDNPDEKRMAWEDLDSIHNSIITGATQVLEEANLLIDKLRDSGNIQDPARFDQCVQTFHDDIQHIIDSANNVVARVKDKVSNPVGEVLEEDFTIYINAGTEYQTIYSEFPGLIIGHLEYFTAISDSLFRNIPGLEIKVPQQLICGRDYTFPIPNYDQDKEYMVRPISGSATIEQGVVHYHAPESPCQGGFTITDTKTHYINNVIIDIVEES